jgi:8-oxo-dGTP pyrophosphatase MutT (NUDIX family)
MALGIPVTPKPAATVVLVRTDRGTREVFLTRRPKSMAFLGGYYVFPGGRVDAADLTARATERIIGARPDDIEKLNRDGHDPLGFYTAAVRELFEESGVLLLCDEAGQIVSGKLYREIRQPSHGHGAPFVEEAAVRNLFFAGHRLEFLQLFTTPAFSPMRFYTVFFLAELPEGQEAGLDNPEVEQWLWIEPATALEKNRSGAFPMIPPTMAALHMVMSR